MSGTSLVGHNHGTLILISSQREQLAQLESITERWNIVSVLLESPQPRDFVANLTSGGKTVIAALDADASAFVIALDPDVFRNVPGLCLVGEAAAQLRHARLLRYHGDMVFLAKSAPFAHTLTMLRRRFAGLRCAIGDDADCVRHALSALLDRICGIRSYAGRAPLVSWR